MNGKTVDDVAKRTVELVKLYADKLIPEQFEGMAPGLKELNDHDFFTWFTKQMAEQGPDWARALEYVDGGKTELRRYLRIKARRDVILQRMQRIPEVPVGS